MVAVEKSSGNDVQPGERIRQILLAYDGSQHAEAALQWLCSLPIGDNHITALAVMPTQYITGHEALAALLEDVQARLRARGLKVQTMLKAGNPAATINATAAELQSDLIVMGAKGLRATLGILLGGVAQQVVEYSCCPVLVVRAPFSGLQHILLVTDGSPHSRKAVEYLAPPCRGELPPGGEARCFWLPLEAQVHVMHVLPPSIPPDITSRAWTLGPEVLYPVPIDPADREKLESEEQRQGQALLSDTLEMLERANIHARSVLRRGDAATEILEYVKEQGTDLIVCGSRGLSQVTGWLLGSLSRKLVHYASCSVLIVK